MFAKHSPPARRKNPAPSAERTKRKKGESSRGKESEEVDSAAAEVRNSTQIPLKVGVKGADPNAGCSDGGGEKAESGQEKGPALISNQCGDSGGGKKSHEAAINAEPEETKADRSKVGKLSDTMYRPFGSRSRSTSPSVSDYHICKGGSNGKCGKEVVNSDKAMQCDRCDRWYHCSCQGSHYQHMRLQVTTKSLCGFAKDVRIVFGCLHHPKGIRWWAMRWNR